MRIMATISRTFAAGIAAAALILLPVLAQAQAKPMKIGFVNVARLLAESPQAAAASRQLDNEFGPRQRELVAKQKTLQERADKLKKDGAVMGAEERRNAEAGLRKDEREFARLADELREDVNRRQNEAIGKLRVDLGTEVAKFARQNGYDLIISDAAYVDLAIARWRMLHPDLPVTLADDGRDYDAVAAARMGVTASAA